VRKLRVGVLVNEFKPEVGGAHNFVQSIASQIPFEEESLELIDFVLILEQPCDGAVSKQVLCVQRSRIIESRILKAHKRGRKGRIFRILNALNPVNRMIQKHEIDFLFFLGSSAIPVSVPFGVIVWDVQHRTHPWFPELQEGWELRDDLAKIVLPRASVVVTGTTVGKNELISLYGAHERNVFIIPHPVPSDVPELEHSNQSEVFNFLYPAQFWPHKNHVVILEALRILKDAGCGDFKVILVGADKGNLSYLKKLIDEYKIHKFVELKGFVSRNDLLELYAHSDALLYSSFSGPENLPPLEAFKSGIPVLYSDFPGAREQLGAAAYYFNPHDERDLAARMQDLIENQVLRESLVEQGRVQLVGRTSVDFSNHLVSIFRKFYTSRRSWGNQ
jgi:glycosyltransferase involved in cell wall biosynthesis